MKTKIIIQTIGSVAKEEKLITLNNHIIPNTLVLENEEPYPGYHGKNLPTGSKPISIFLITKEDYSTQKILRINKKIKKYFQTNFDAVPGLICLNNEKLPCIRIRDIKNYDVVGDLQKCFFSEKISFMKKRKIDASGVIILKKLFNLEMLEDYFYKDEDEASTFYFRISRQLSFPEFLAVMHSLRNNLDPDTINFDAALASVYTKDVLDLVRVYSKGADLDYLKMLQQMFETEMKKMD